MSNPSHRATEVEDLVQRLILRRHRAASDYDDGLAADLAAAANMLRSLERDLTQARAIFRTRSDDAIARDKNGREREAARGRRS